MEFEYFSRKVPGLEELKSLSEADSLLQKHQTAVHRILEEHKRQLQKLKTRTEELDKACKLPQRYENNDDIGSDSHHQAQQQQKATTRRGSSIHNNGDDNAAADGGINHDDGAEKRSSGSDDLKGMFEANNRKMISPDRLRGSAKRSSSNGAAHHHRRMEASSSSSRRLSPSSLTDLAKMLSVTASRMQLDERDLEKEKAHVKHSRGIARKLQEEAREMVMAILKTLEKADSMLKDAEFSKMRVESQIGLVLQGLEEMRRKEEAYATERTRELRERDYSIKAKMGELQSLQEDLEESKMAFEVKRAAFDLHVEAARGERKAAADERKEEEETNVVRKLQKLAQEEGEKEDKERLHQQIPPSFTCPITCEIMLDPVITADGYSYERLAIQKWLRKKGKHPVSPQTGLPLDHRRLVPNISLRNSIEEFFKDRPQLRDDQA